MLRGLVEVRMLKKHSNLLALLTKVYKDTTARPIGTVQYHQCSPHIKCTVLQKPEMSTPQGHPRERKEDTPTCSMLSFGSARLQGTSALPTFSAFNSKDGKRFQRK